MIEKIERTEQIEDWTGSDIYTIRILSLLKSYGTKYNFAVFYRQVVDGRITAIMSCLDRHFTLSVTDGFDNEEIVRFLCVTGYSSLLCNDRLLLSSKYDEGIVMSCDKKLESFAHSNIIDEYPKLMDLYNFVDYDGQDFKAWYVDISHRVRHKTAKAYTLNIDGEIVSSGILSSIFDNCAILTAVRTSDEFRRMGYGSELVSHIVNDVKGTVYIMRDKGLNESFYTKLGFENTGIWRIYK